MAAAGVVDFRDARPSDRLWSLRLRWLAASFAETRRGDVALASHMRYTGALGTDDAKLFEQAWKHSGQTLDELDHALRPWLEQQKRASQADEDLVDKYRKVIGDMADPAFRSRMDQIANDLIENLPPSAREAVRAEARSIVAVANA